MFDEPSSYLDIKQRPQGSRGLLTPDFYVVAVEHDLSGWLYSHRTSAFSGIALFQDGRDRQGGYRRQNPTLLLPSDDQDSWILQTIYEPGSFTDSEINVMLGENGTEKTIFVRLLAGVDTPDIETDELTLSVSLKPQTITPKFSGTVRMLVSKADQGGVYAGHRQLLFPRGLKGAYP